MSLNITLKLSSSVDKYTLKFYHHQLISFNEDCCYFESWTSVHRAQLAILRQLHTGTSRSACNTLTLAASTACNTFSISGGSPRACASVVVLLLWKLPPWCTTPRLMVHHTTHPGALRAEGDKLLLFWRCARNNFLLFRCCAQNIKPISTRGQKMTEIEFMWPIYCKMSNM